MFAVVRQHGPYNRRVDPLDEPQFASVLQGEVLDSPSDAIDVRAFRVDQEILRARAGIVRSGQLAPVVQFRAVADLIERAPGAAIVGEQPVAVRIKEQGAAREVEIGLEQLHVVELAGHLIPLEHLKPDAGSQVERGAAGVDGEVARIADLHRIAARVAVAVCQSSCIAQPSRIVGLLPPERELAAADAAADAERDHVADALPRFEQHFAFAPLPTTGPHDIEPETVRRVWVDRQSPRTPIALHGEADPARGRGFVGPPERRAAENVAPLAPGACREPVRAGNGSRHAGYRRRPGDLVVVRRRSPHQRHVGLRIPEGCERPLVLGR